MISAFLASSPAAHPALLAPPLAANAHVDVCFVGAGVAGMLAAYLLARDGHEVLVLDEGPIGGGRTALDSASLATFGRPRFAEVLERHGDLGLRVAAQSHAAAVDALERTVRHEHIACEFERLDAYVFDTPERLEREAAAADRAAIESELLAHSPVEGLGPCLRLPRQATLHPYKFLAGLAHALVREGGRIHCGVGVMGVRSGSPAQVLTTAGHCVEAGAVVTAQRRGEPKTVHAVGLQVPRGWLPRALYGEMETGRRVALRSQGHGAVETLVASDAPQPLATIDEAPQHHLALAQWTRERFPRAGELAFALSGEAVETEGHLALLAAGRSDSESLFVATGHADSSLAAAAIASLVIHDFIGGAKMPWTEFFTMHSAGGVPAAAHAAPIHRTPSAAAQ